MSGAVAATLGAKAHAFLNHPAGPKTVFFWAPMAKWALVAAGFRDLTRPANKLSVAQSVALAATGFIWVRWSFMIIPKNYSLAAVNLFVGATGIGQLARIHHYNRTHEDPVHDYLERKAPTRVGV